MFRVIAFFISNCCKLKVYLRRNQILLGGGYGTLGLHDGERRQRSCRDLLLVVRKSLVRKIEGALLYGHVLVRIHQVPINIFDLRDCRDDLVTET